VSNSISTKSDGSERPSPSTTIQGMVLRLLILAVFDVGAVWLIVNMFQDGLWPLGGILTLITAFVNVVLLREEMYPLRWMLIGLSLLMLLSVYPILYTVWISFTNYGDGHLLTQQQSIEQLEQVRFLPETATEYTWTAFQNSAGGFALWLVDGNNNVYLARPNEPIQTVTDVNEFAPLDDAGIPLALPDYVRLARLQTVPLIDEISRLEFGDEEYSVRVRNLDSAAATQARYVYDAAMGTITDMMTGTVYTAVNGRWTAPDGSTIPPGFIINIGFANFIRFFSSPAISGPLVRVTIWNFVFAFLTVITTFFLGLFTALLFSDLWGKKVIFSLLIIPYTIPSLVTILVWRGMLNPQVGVINSILNNIFGIAPDWFNDPNWARAGILLVNLWLGYPYFMLVCSGALQGIPTDIYSAADVDGANAWAKFWKITMPLLLVAVGPLLVASYVFNFNNFNVIFLYNNGGPPIAGAATSVGHTDILISYVYSLAFQGARGADFGFASAISIIIFMIVIVITLFQFRFTNMWEGTE
jgi:arabinogalactan oligomer / maltooligosaccharide transport system permease protein